VKGSSSEGLDSTVKGQTPACSEGLDSTVKTSKSTVCSDMNKWKKFFCESWKGWRQNDKNIKKDLGPIEFLKYKYIYAPRNIGFSLGFHQHVFRTPNGFLTLMSVKTH
jgi:hypothetical protein